MLRLSMRGIQIGTQRSVIRQSESVCYIVAKLDRNIHRMQLKLVAVLKVKSLLTANEAKGMNETDKYMSKFRIHLDIPFAGVVDNGLDELNEKCKHNFETKKFGKCSKWSGKSSVETVKDI